MDIYWFDCHCLYHYCSITWHLFSELPSIVFTMNYIHSEALDTIFLSSQAISLAQSAPSLAMAKPLPPLPTPYSISFHLDCPQSGSNLDLTWDLACSPPQPCDTSAISGVLAIQTQPIIVHPSSFLLLTITTTIHASSHQLTMVPSNVLIIPTLWYHLMKSHHIQQCQWDACQHPEDSEVCQFSFALWIP